MTTPDKKEDVAASDQELNSQVPSAEPDEPVLRRPDDDIAHRPLLKVRPIGSRPAEPAKPGLRGGTLYRAQPKPEETAPHAEAPAEPAEEPAPPKVALPAPEEVEANYAYATHRPAPPDEKAEKEALAAMAGTKPEREVPTALVLGIALIVVALLSGVFIVRLSRKVGALERRIGRLEGPPARTTASRPQTVAPRPARASRNTAKARTASASRIR